MRIVRFTLFTLYISAFTFQAQALNQNESNFKLLNQRFLSFFKKMAPNDVKITIYDNWDINYPAASTDRSTDFEITMHRSPVEWNVSILSGYFQNELGGHDAHILTLCHEMAHHLGGKPYKTDEQGKIRWASMEAQSDYWATKVCIPAFLKEYPVYLILRKVIHPEIKRRCGRKFNRYFRPYKICLFSAQAAYQMAKIHQKFKLPSEPDEPPVNPETPDPNYVNELDRNNYPGNQCRFDTSFAGALEEPRPRCWYPAEL